jgi:hypothetical protein
MRTSPVKYILLALLVLAAAPALLPAEDSDAWELAHSWDGTLARIKEGKPKAYALFIGRQKSLLWTRIRAGQVKLGDTWVFRLSANDQVTNPYTGRTVLGSQMIQNMTGPLNDLTGGSLLFFDADFILLPRFTLIQNFHRSRPEVVSFYCQMVTEPLRDRLTMAEYARYQNQPIGLELAMEAAAGKHKDFSHLYREIGRDEILFRGVDAKGTVIDPRVNGGIHIVTRDPNGEVFLALMREYWEKLAVGSGSEKQRPPLVVFGPATASYPGLDAMNIRYTAVSLTEDQLNGYASPRTILPEQAGSDSKRRGAIEISGFVPGQVIGEFVLGKQASGLLNDFRMLHPDIPFGDVDVERTLPLPAKGGQP